MNIRKFLQKNKDWACLLGTMGAFLFLASIAIALEHHFGWTSPVGIIGLA